MCGIAGIVGDSIGDRSTRMRAMRDALVHRGPDSEGELVDGYAALGVRRLRIIDLVTGDQPQANEDRTVWTVFNGEIYNFMELRGSLAARGHRFATDSDTEVIVHLYEDQGVDLVRSLRGMFAFALWDQRERTLLLARDPLGKKPLLYWVGRGEIVFASEHEALLRGLSSAPDVSWTAVRLYLGLGYVPAPHDAFVGVRKLLPGHLLRWRDGEMEVQRYWAPPPSGTLRIREEEAVGELRRLLRAAVARRLIADVPVGAFLSGGVDSSSVVATMSDLTSEVRTFTIGFEEADFSEVQYAREVAKRFATQHHELIVRPLEADAIPLLVSHYGEPYADSSALPTYHLSRFTREHVTVALNGDGGDEIFAGYDRYVALRLAGTLDRIPFGLGRLGLAAAVRILPGSSSGRTLLARARRLAVGGSQRLPDRYIYWTSFFDDAVLSSLLTEDFRAQTDAYARPGQMDGMDWASDPVAAAQQLDLVLYLPHDLLVKVDIASMATSLEVRSPFLDLDLVEFAIRLPVDLKLRGLHPKYLLTQAMRGVLPDRILDRPKRGFAVPVAAWFRNELRDALCETILSDHALSRGYFRSAQLQALVADHMEGRSDHGQRLWALLILELWHRQFVDGHRTPITAPSFALPFARAIFEH